MSDIKTVWNTSNGDWLLAGVTLASGDDLQSAVLISLFTDRVALIDDVPPDGSGDPRGWWADDAVTPVGSRLWLLWRAKRTQQTLQAAQDYAIEALQWLVDDGVAAGFDVFVEWESPSTLAMQVTVIKNDGETVAINFPTAWAGVN